MPLFGILDSDWAKASCGFPYWIRLSCFIQKCGAKRKNSISLAKALHFPKENFQTPMKNIDLHIRPAVEGGYDDFKTHPHPHPTNTISTLKPP